jgi:hypothetical protein
MRNVGMRQLELYRAPKGWRFAVTEVPEAMACGQLLATALEAPFAEAETELLSYLKEEYAVDLRPEWAEGSADWWTAQVGARRTG